MLPEFPNSLSLLQHAESDKLYQKLLLQLDKDFKLANISIEIRRPITPQELVSLLREKLYRLIMENMPKCLDLFYIVDIPESALAGLKGEDAVEKAEQLSFLLLKRIWKKVWYKERYS
ncbi:MAG: hypothetical protein ABF293_10390 [Flavobacteriaceae bacterium]